MDPITLSILASIGISTGGSVINTVLNRIDAAKTRKDNERIMQAAYRLQNDKLNRQMNLAKKNSALDHEELIDELVNFSLEMSSSGRSEAEQIAAMRTR